MINPSRLASQGSILVLLIILAASLTINLWNNNFGFYHPDELKKTKFVKEGWHDFHHPALMVVVAHAVNQVVGLDKNLDVVRLGRVTTALFGTLCVFFVFLISRRIMSMPFALLSTAAAAFSPILVVHAHYLKEDIIAACFLTGTLWAYWRFWNRVDAKNTALLGVMSGLAFSSHYKCILMLILFLICPLLIRREGLKRYFGFLGWAMLIAVVEFIAVNHWIFANWDLFRGAVEFDLEHITTGHVLKIYPLDHFFLWHYLNSIGPGMTWAMAIPATIAIIWVLVRWERTETLVRILVLYTILFYLAVEITPMKAFPGYMRYVIAVIPVMVILAVYGVSQAWEWARARWNAASVRIIGIIAIAALLIYPAYDAVALTYYLNKDTRDEAIAWITSTPNKIMVESYVFPVLQPIGKLTDKELVEWQASNHEYLVSSSFQYARYLLGKTMKRQDQVVYEIAEKYEKIFKFPYREIRPRHRTFSVSNPVIRIVDIRVK